MSRGMLHDKKARDQGLSFVLNRGIGDFAFVTLTDLAEVLAVCGIGR